MVALIISLLKCNLVEMQSIFLHCERALAVVVYCNAMQCNEIYFLAMRLCIGGGGGAMWCSLFVLGHNAPFSNSHSLLQSATCCSVFASILFRRKSKSRSDTNPNAIQKQIQLHLGNKYKFS